MKDTAEDIETRALRRSLRARRPLVLAARGLVWALGWASFAILLTATLAEHHPALERWVARTVRERVGGPLTQTVEVADVDFRWLDRAVAFRGISMGPSGEELLVDEVTCRIGWTWSRGLHLDRVELNGGTLVLSESLAVDMEGGGQNDVTTLDVLADSPEVIVRDLAIIVDPPGGDSLDVGSVDLCMTRITDELASIYGRLVPALGARPEDSGVVWLNGTLDANRVARMRGVARGLPISTDPLSGRAASDGLLPERLAEFDPRARIDLVAHGSYEIGRSLLPEINATLRVSDGSLVLPWLDRAEQRPLRDVEILVDAAFAPPDPEHPFDPDAWRARGTLGATWEEVRARSEFRLGRDAPEGAAFEIWADLPSAPLGERLVALVAGEKGIVQLDEMLASEGTADLSIGVRLPRDVDPGVPIAQALERFALVRAKGNAGLSYQGGIDRKTGQRDIGFPVPVRGVVGDVTWSIRSEGTYQGQLAFYDVTAYHAGGPVRVQGSLQFTPAYLFEDASLVELLPSPFHLIVSTTGLPVDEEFERGFAGLYGLEGMDEILPTWNPQGGSIDFALELWRTEERREMSSAIDATFDRVGFRWRELAVPIEDGTGWLRVRTNGARERASVQIGLEATSPVARGPIRAEGRVVGEGQDRSLIWFNLEAGEVNPVYRELRTELARKNPATVTALDASGVAGFIDVAATTIQPIPTAEAAALRAASPDEGPFLGGMEAWIAATPADDRSGVQLQPSNVGIVTREGHGRVAAKTLLPPEPARGAARPETVETSTTVLGRVQGTWRQDGPSVPVVGFVSVPAYGLAELRAFGAGLDIANKGLVGALTNVARTTSSSRDVDPFDTDQFEVEGRVDFGTRFTLPEAPGVPIEDIEISVEARLDRLGIRASQLLRDVSAHFRFEANTGEWIGEEVDARLGETPVRLTNLAWIPNEVGSTFKTRIAAQGLPIDREHLSFFLDPATVRTILDDLDASGRFDMNGADLTVSKRGDGTTSVLLDGELSVRDGFVNLGVPVELRRVESMQVEMAHEGRGLRSTATVRGFNGAIADRRLQDAGLQLSYVEPRLVIEAVDGSFEGGRLSAVGGDVSRGASLFSIDLAPPFPFRLAAKMSDVDVGEFLRGMFDSDFANRGRMDMTMRLEGDFEHLTELKGGGEIIIDESALWAIPVFQALSVGLGIDTTVLFREMYCGYTIEDGVLTMNRMRINSDLLSLVGTGSISFEGNVTSDFEVRYAFVDRLGPFTRLLYWIQNSLLRVSVRGTMERPTVVLRGLISQFFAPSEERNRLPLPGFSERPRRF